MNTTQHQDEILEVQAAIYRVALSLDSFLLNGIPYGVIPRAGLDGFLEHVADLLLRDLAALEAQASQAPVAGQPEIKQVLAALRSRIQQLIDLLTELRSFQTFSREQLRSTLAQIPLLRAECAMLIQELEGCFSTPKPFYSSRPTHSAASVDTFLANLEQLFATEGVISNGDD